MQIKKVSIGHFISLSPKYVRRGISYEGAYEIREKGMKASCQEQLLVKKLQILESNLSR